jgi:hypothetical protein
MKKLLILMAVMAASTIGLVQVASAGAPLLSPINDGCADASPNSVDIDVLEVESDGTDVFVWLDMCSSVNSNAKYRVHIDIDAESDVDNSCETTSDFTLILHRRGGSNKFTGPAESNSLQVDEIHWEVSYAALGVSSGEVIHVWADTHKKGIKDRAPDTDDGDGCGKPEGEHEVLTHTLSAPT